MRFLLVALTLLFSIQGKEQESKTYFKIRMESSLMGVMDVVEVTPGQITKVRSSWRMEQSLTFRSDLDLAETEYLGELITSEEFGQIESNDLAYKCIGEEIPPTLRLPFINLYITVEETGEKNSKRFTFSCLCSEYPATDAPEILCNILDDIYRLEMEHLQ